MLILLMALLTQQPASTVPALGPLVARPSSELEEVIERFSTDRTALTRRYDADDSITSCSTTI
jgi:hypothetical protein